MIPRIILILALPVLLTNGNNRVMLRHEDVTLFSLKAVSSSSPRCSAPMHGRYRGTGSTNNGWNGEGEYVQALNAALNILIRRVASDLKSICGI